MNRDDLEQVERSFKSSAKREGRDYRVLCPFCTSSKTGRADHSMGVEAATGVFHCFRCGSKGKLHEAPDPSQAGAEAAPLEQVPIAPPEGFTLVGVEPGLSSYTFEPARTYLETRGVTTDMARELSIGAVADGYYCGRVIVPVIVRGHEGWIGWVARDWSGRAERPYLYPRNMPRGLFLFNHDALSVETDVPLMIVEGVFDALALWPDAAAVLGKPSHAQVDALAVAKRPVCIVLDGDAWREGEALAMRLRFDGQRAGAIRLPPKVDPDEVDPVWLRARAVCSLGESL